MLLTTVARHVAAVCMTSCPTPPRAEPALGASRDSPRMAVAFIEDNVHRDITRPSQRVERGRRAGQCAATGRPFEGSLGVVRQHEHALADNAISRSAYAAKARSRDDAALAIEPGMRCR